MGQSVQIRFDADTASFRANVDAATGSVDKSAQAVADAKNAILSSFRMQVQAAKEVGASSQELQAIASRAAQQMAQVTEQNADRTIKALDRIREKQKAVAEELKNLPTPKGTDAGHGFSDRTAVSAVARAGEGTTSIRAIESFATMIPGVAAGARVLATVIGGAGLIGLLTELGEKGYEAFVKLRDATKNASLAAEDLNEKGRISIDTKEIENQKLQDQIDKLSGHPNNGLASALLEAKKNADDLISSLRTAFTEQQALFKAQERGFTDNALHVLLNAGPEGTKTQGQQLTKDDNAMLAQIMAERDTLDQALSHAKTDADRKRATDTYNAGIDRLITPKVASDKTEADRLQGDNSVNWTATILKALTGGGVTPLFADNSLKTGNMQEHAYGLKEFLQGQKLDSSIYDRQTTLGQVKQDNALDKQGDEAARKAAEAQRKQWDDEADRAKLPIDLSTGLPQDPATPRQMYDLRTSQLQGALPQNKVDAEKNVVQAYQEWLRSSTEQTKQIHEQAAKAERDQWQTQYDTLENAGHMTAQAQADYWNLAMLESEQGSANYLEAEKRYTAALKQAQADRDRAEDARNKAGLQNANDQARISEANVALEQQTGQISKYDAAVQMANIHTQQYISQMAALKSELAKQQAIDPDSAGSVSAQEAIDKAAADRTVQIQQDAAKTAAESWEGALKNANAVWVQDSQDSAAQVKALYAQTINGFNDQAANAITGGKTDWSGYVRGIGKSVVKSGLEQGEGAIMGALGLAKPDGSSSKPFYVRMAEGAAAIGQGASSLFGGLSKLFGGGSSSSGSTTDTGDAVSSIADKALGGFADAISMGGGFALGGDVKPGTSITAGEMGPERITFGPGTSAHVTANKDLGSGAPTNNYFSFGQHVTREDVVATVNSMLSQHIPALMNGATHAVKNQQQRRPASAR